MSSKETAGFVELNALKAKLGIYVPIYKGWVRGVDEGENDPTFQYAAETTAKAEEIGIDSIWVADHLLNPQKGEREKSLSLDNPDGSRSHHQEDGTLPHYTMPRLSAPGRPSEDVRHFGRHLQWQI